MTIDKSQQYLDDIKALEDFITGVSSTLPSVELLKRARLEPYVYTKHVKNDNFKKAYVQAHTRHQLISSEVYKFVKACLEVNIEVLLFKGFYLAEFVYDSPAARFYGDVDVLIDPIHLDSVIEVAKTLNWDYEYVGFGMSDVNHDIATLQSKTSGTNIDVHRFPFATAPTHRKKQENITKSIWDNSRKIIWKDIPISVMQPVDVLLSGLILNRFWWDGIRHKPHDYIDFQQLIELFSISELDLKDRAQEFKSSNTLTLYQRSCNPFNKTLVLKTQPKKPRLIDNYNIIKERGPIRITLWVARLRKLPQLSFNSILALPLFLEITYLFRRHKDLETVLKKIIQSKPVVQQNNQTLTSNAHKNIVQVCKWLTLLLMPRTEGRCLVRSLLMFKLLKREGVKPVFLAGVRRRNGNLESHAWVELDGRCLDGTGDNFVRHTYTVNVSSDDFRD